MRSMPLKKAAALKAFYGKTNFHQFRVKMLSDSLSRNCTSLQLSG